MSTTSHLMTAEELLRLPDDGQLHELIKGELLTMSPPGAEHGVVTMNLSFLLAQHVRPRKLGVWLVNPKTRTVDVRLANGERKLFKEDDILTDDAIVKGFRVSVSEIFD